MNRPAEDVLIHDGIKVNVSFMPSAVDGEPNAVAVIFPLFGGYYASQDEQEPYQRAARVVADRLEKLGYAVDR